MPIKVQYDIYDTQHKAPIISTTDRTLASIEFHELIRKGDDLYRMQQTPMADGALTKQEEYLMLVYRVRKLWKQYFNQGRNHDVLLASVEQEKKLDDWHRRVSSLSKNNSIPLPIKDREAFDFFIVVRGWRDAWKERKNYRNRKDSDEAILSEMSKKCRDFEKKIDQYIKDKLGLI